MVICRCIWRKSSIILPRSAVTDFVSWSWATHILYMMTVVIVEIGRPTCLIHGAVVFLLRNKDDWSFSKSSYILRRPQNFEKSSPFFCPTYVVPKVRWRFRKISWPSQNIWTSSNLFILLPSAFKPNWTFILGCSFWFWDSKLSNRSSSLFDLGFRLYARRAVLNIKRGGFHESPFLISIISLVKFEYSE